MGSTNYEILVSRMIDRSIRPLFESRDTYNTETQVFKRFIIDKNILNQLIYVLGYLQFVII